MKKLAVSLLFALYFCAASFATQISFQIVQKDSTCKEVNDKSYDIETFVLDGFFDRNYIVTTSEPTVFETEADSSSLWKNGLREAFDGSSDYFVQIAVYYIADENLRNPVGMIDRIEWKLAVVKTGIVIGSDSVTEIQLKPNGLEDLGKISLNLVKTINNSIKA